MTRDFVEKADDLIGSNAPANSIFLVAQVLDAVEQARLPPIALRLVAPKSYDVLDRSFRPFKFVGAAGVFVAVGQVTKH